MCVYCAKIRHIVYVLRCCACSLSLSRSHTAGDPSLRAAQMREARAVSSCDYTVMDTSAPHQSWIGTLPTTKTKTLALPTFRRNITDSDVACVTGICPADGLSQHDSLALEELLLARFMRSLEATEPPRAARCAAVNRRQNTARRTPAWRRSTPFFKHFPLRERHDIGCPVWGAAGRTARLACAANLGCMLAAN